MMGEVVSRIGPARRRAPAFRQTAGEPEAPVRLFRALHNVELFTGAGGLSLGLAAAGIIAEHLFEKNARCCATLTTNKTSGVGVSGTVHRLDVRDVDWSEVPRPVRVLAAGPPCQPFSLAGNHKGDRDHRNEFPAMLTAVRELRPAVVLVENVQGLTRPSFRPYFDYIIRQLAYPSIPPLGEGEDWMDHEARLASTVATRPPEYAVRWKVLNAADYGVAQIRTRTVIIATRAGLPTVELPARSHSRAALLADQAAGTYWDRHDLPRPNGFAELDGGADPDDPDLKLRPWRTVRDALSGLRAPTDSSEDPLQHWVVPGARTYRGHRGSVLDWPSKTIKAGVHGVAGGENIVNLDDGTFRYFTLREMARIQGFPDAYVFEGPRSRIIGQIGNAVPCGLAEAVGRAIATMLEVQPELSERAAAVTVTSRKASTKAVAASGRGARFAH
jgi:DNA (cytosine-5)-methyltransferase 1